MIDRHIPGTAATPAPGPGTSQAAPRDRGSLWTKLIGSASPAQQRDLLALARRQGVLYSHQVAVNGNGAPPERGRLLLTGLLDPATTLDPVRSEPFEPLDSALDEIQREAVAKALASPDVCLIQGLPGTGKSRASVELMLQTVRRGERVLLTGVSPTALDCTLEKVARHDSVFAVRCLDLGEKLETLPLSTQCLTAAQRLNGLRTDGLATLRREADEFQASGGRYREQRTILERALALLQQQAELDRQIADLRRQREAIPEQVQQSALTASDAALAASLRPIQEAKNRARAESDTALADLRRQLSSERETLTKVENECRPLQALADARDAGRWWTASWWRASLASGALARLDGLNRDCRQHESAVARLAAEEGRLVEAQKQADERYQAEWQACCAAAVSRLQAGIDAQLGEREREGERRQVQEQWQGLQGQLGRSLEQDASALEQVLAANRDEQAKQEERAAFAREWHACLTQRAEGLAGWLAASANVVAMPLAVIGSDPHFGESAQPGLAFDLAIVEESQRLTEADFVRLARRAKRLVLVSDSEREANPGLKGQPAPALFHRLWQRLHGDPRQLPYSWLLENGRLCCRLRHCPAEQRRHLESERVADFPDIELRILTLPRAAPALAELLFPPTMTISQAKEYIYRELQELPVQAQGRSYRWQDEPDRLVLRLADQPTVAPMPVMLERGIRELVVESSPVGTGPAGPFTCGIEFDKIAGWDRSRAEEWVLRHLGVRDLGRTIRFEQAYRMGADLAAVVADILFAGGYRPGSLVGNGNGTGPAVEFVAVPGALPTEKQGAGRKTATAGKSRLARQGAGLELDLADPRQRSRLPAEVRDRLPADGMVNYFEAQAVVRKLESLAKLGNGTNGAGIGVLALYPAQATLIRVLVNQSPRLKGLDVVIGTPESFRQRESAVLLVSLTRSHTNRAVPYGDGAASLAVALTRARHQLILFGDPGTLARRGQWERAVDHLDELTAAREREVVTRLCEYLQGKGTHARAFHLDEGIGP